MSTRCLCGVSRLVVAAALGLAAALPAAADSPRSRALHCLATAIYFEARGESAKGQRAVAEVVLARTRVKGRPKTVCGVVYQGSHRKWRFQFSFACDGRSDVARNKKAWTRSKRIAAAALGARGKAKTKVVRGATFYHARYVKPRWAKRMVVVARIGSHIFYRPKHGRLS